MKQTRRNFFLLAGGGLLLAQDKTAPDMIVKSTRPEDLEMPLAGFADYITPPERFFVRTHVYVPTVNANDWKLKVEGAVGTPLTLAMDDLRRMPAVDLVAVTECAGTGRSFFDPPVPGLQWANGGVANGRWRGVRLADVLKRAGVKESSVEVLFDGADVPLGTMQDFRRSITMKKALDPSTLLAYEMNGGPIPLKHGFPMRVVAAGWASDSWVKWLTSITVLDTAVGRVLDEERVSQTGSSGRARYHAHAGADGAGDQSSREDGDRLAVRWRGRGAWNGGDHPWGFLVGRCGSGHLG